MTRSHGVYGIFCYAAYYKIAQTEEALPPEGPLTCNS